MMFRHGFAFCCGSRINVSWRTWKRHQIAPTYTHIYLNFTYALTFYRSCRKGSGYGEGPPTVRQTSATCRRTYISSEAPPDYLAPAHFHRCSSSSSCSRSSSPGRLHIASSNLRVCKQLPHQSDLSVCLSAPPLCHKPRSNSRRCSQKSKEGDRSMCNPACVPACLLLESFTCRSEGKWWVKLCRHWRDDRSAVRIYRAEAYWNWVGGGARLMSCLHVRGLSWRD
jgi:hypothetical protein